MLRDYQSDICNKVNRAFEKHRSVMMQMPTGTGKTVVLAELVKHQIATRGPQQRHAAEEGECVVLVVAHRMELIEQTGEFLSRYGIDYGIIANGKKAKKVEPVMVASIQTLAKRLQQTSSQKGDALLASLCPRCVIIDEAHHAVAKSYRLLWEQWPEAKFLGLTATPYRLSGEGFTDLFEVLVSSWHIKQFIASGWLSPFDYYSIRPDSEAQRLIDALQKRGADGDYQMKELRETLDVHPSIEGLFETFERFAFDKKGIVYAIDIAHAEHIAAYYTAQGVRAVALSSKTPQLERQAAAKAFKEEGTIQVLVSVDLFSEGFDCPDVEFIQLARPTLSLAKYMQMVGRGLRPCEGKTYCTILDNVGLYRTFGLPSVDRDWESFFFEENLLLGFEGKQQGPHLWLGCNSLPEENDADVVRIASHEEIKTQLPRLDSVGFERKKKGKTWVWMDRANGIEFDRRPQVVNFRIVELSTADGETFYPRVRSKWIDAKHGISWKALETQAGEGIAWQRLYISMEFPHKVLQLLSVEPNQARIYADEEGKIFLQQDLDHAPVCEDNEVSRDDFMARCDELLHDWMDRTKHGRGIFLKKDTQKGQWLLPEGCVKMQDAFNGMLHNRFCHISYKDSGQGGNKDFWVDWNTGFVLRQRPVIRQRGFVELLFDGEMVFILNIHEERFVPYHNWEIRADERICTIGNKMYFYNNKDGTALRIKKRSGDFQMFVVQDEFDMKKFKAGNIHDLMVINKFGADLELRKIPVH